MQPLDFPNLLTQPGGVSFGPEIATLETGVVVVWNENSPEPVYGDVIFGFGNEQVNTFADPDVANETRDNFQTFSHVDSNDDGFVITWSQGGGALLTSETLVRLFATDGTPLTSEIVVNQNDAGRASRPEVAFLTDGSFVVVWENQGVDEFGVGVSGRHYAANGTPLSDEFIIPSDASLNEFGVTLTALDTGGFVVTWSVYDEVTTERFVRFRIFDENADPVGPDQTVELPDYSNDPATYDVFLPSIATLTSGDFVVTGFLDDLTDDFGTGMFVERYLPDGTPLNWPGAVAIAGNETGFVNFPTVVGTPDDGIIVSFEFQYENLDFSEANYFRTDAEGVLVSSGTVSTDEDTDANNYGSIRAVVAEDGRVVFVYQGTELSTSHSDIFLRQYEAVLYGTDSGAVLADLTGGQRFEGGAGGDAVDYSDAAGRVLVDLQIDQSAAGFARFFTEGAGAGDVYASIEGVIGSAFADNLRGDGGANVLAGGGVSDRLYGRAGDDTLLGDGGADAIYGNRGADVMAGGDDTVRDRFIFFSIDESTPDARDVITDFTPGEDRIEISRFDADITQGLKQRFDWIGDVGFSGTAGELGYRHEGGATIVQADVDGDAIADFEIELAGTLDLTATDFLI